MSKKTLDKFLTLVYNCTVKQPANLFNRLKSPFEGLRFNTVSYTVFIQYYLLPLSIGVLTVASYLIDADPSLQLAGFLAGLFSGSKGADFTAQSAFNANGQQDYQRLANTAQMGTDQARAGMAAGQQGMGAQSDILQQLMMQALGQGPNPAQQALANATGQNAAMQASMAAGARGTASNPALAARQAAMTGAGLQQQAAGQGALMQAQQQLAAQQAAGQLGGQLVQQQQQNIGMAGQLAQAPVNAGLQNIQQQNEYNSGIAKGNQSFQAGVAKDALSQAGKGLSLIGGGLGLPFAHGGEVPGSEKGLKPGDHEDNDIVPVLLSPGEIVIPRSYASDPKAAAAFAHACAMFGNKKDK